MQVSVRTARPAEFDTVGDLTVAAYRALPVDHLWGGYEADIRDVAGRVRSRATCSSRSTRTRWCAAR